MRSSLGGDLLRLCSNEGLRKTAYSMHTDKEPPIATNVTKHHQTGVEPVDACCVRDGERELDLQEETKGRECRVG